MLYAHIREDGTTQTVEEHLRGTAMRSAEFAAAFGERERGNLIGLAHDIGKCSKEFQNRLNGGPKVDHATAGAIECAKIGETLTGCCVIGHHSGLPNFGDRSDTAGASTYVGRFKRGIEGGIPNYDWQGKLDEITEKPVFSDGYETSFWIRMLYSCLVDADYLDTEAFMTQAQRPKYDTLEILLKRLECYIAPWFPPKTKLNEYRCSVLKQCMERATESRGLYTLTVPTGGGKTVASLAFALKHAVEHNLSRVIYVIPYTSIIDQNAEVFKKILGEENVIEHHSAVQFDCDDESSEYNIRRRMACEN